MDRVSRQVRSRNMRQVPSENTAPERVVRSALHRLGFRFRLHRQDLPGKPDVVLPGRKAVVVVHGCFWHQHEGCMRAARPTSNAAYWDRKLDRNVRRDAEDAAALAAAGWKVLVVWECQTWDEGSLRRLLADLIHDPAPKPKAVATSRPSQRGGRGPGAGADRARRARRRPGV